MITQWILKVFVVIYVSTPRLTFKGKNGKCLGRFADLDSKATVNYVNFEQFVNIIGVSLYKFERISSNLLLLYVVLDLRKLWNMWQNNNQLDMYEEFSEIDYPATWETFRIVYSMPVLIINYFLHLSREITSIYSFTNKELGFL